MNAKGTNVRKLVKQTKNLKIDDNDVGEWEDVKGSFPEHFYSQSISHFCKPSGSGRNPVCIFSDLFSDGKTVLCGMDKGICKSIDLNAKIDDKIVVDFNADRSHTNLSCIRCSKISPQTFYSSSSSEGIIQQWDTRQDSRKPCQKFSTVESGNRTNNATTSKIKPILQFDVSCNDQLLCAGTEMVEDDSYLMFWDVRYAKILGAYWESHSDDVTAVRFHPSQVHSLSSGSTDGLLNVFNLMEPAEDDALLYSFNTNSSVDLLHWHSRPSSDPNIVCVTHTNEVQVWNTNTGDPVIDIKRKLMAEAMMRSNPEAVHINGCYELDGGSSVGVIANSISGGNTRLIKLDNEMKPAPHGIFIDQTSVVQTAQNIPAIDKWVTFDEFGQMKIWSSSKIEDKTSPKKISKSEERRNAKRYKPYSKD